MVEAKSRSASILTLVNRTLVVPTVPEVLIALSEVIAAEDSTADDVAAVIAQDPDVAAHFLRIVNSPCYALQTEDPSIGLAVSVLGFGMTKKLVFEAAIYSRFAREELVADGFDARAFWEHAVFTGVAARVIGAESRNLGGHHGEDLFMCGLLHDIGKVMLLENRPDDYARVLATSKATGREPSDVEREVFGFTHADVGSVLAIKWFMPEDVILAIRYHHKPVDDPFHRSLSSLVHLADHVASRSGRIATPELVPHELRPEVYDAIGIEAGVVEDLLPLIESSFGATGVPV